jgi:hypothetical protein
MSKNRLFALCSLLVIVALALTACGTSADPWENIGTEENPIIFVAVPSGKLSAFLPASKPLLIWFMLTLVW